MLGLCGRPGAPPPRVIGVKLLFDENLSPSLAVAFQSEYPSSTHVHLVGLGSASDDQVWRYARDNGFTIVTKDADYHERSLIDGYPPKVVWVRLGNVSTVQIEAVLREYSSAIERLETDAELATLVI